MAFTDGIVREVVNEVGDFLGLTQIERNEVARQINIGIEQATWGVLLDIVFDSGWFRETISQAEAKQNLVDVLAKANIDPDHPILDSISQIGPEELAMAGWLWGRDDKSAESEAEKAGAAAGEEHAEKTFENGEVTPPATSDIETKGQYDQTLEGKSSNSFWSWANGSEEKREKELQDIEKLNEINEKLLDASKDAAEGKLPNPVTTGLEIALTPSEANQGEKERLEERDEYTQSFQDAAQEEYGRQFDQRLEEQIGPKEDAWQESFAQQQAAELEREHQEMLREMESTKPSSPHESEPDQSLVYEGGGTDTDVGGVGGHTGPDVVETSNPESY